MEIAFALYAILTNFSSTGAAIDRLATYETKKECGSVMRFLEVEKQRWLKVQYVCIPVPKQ